MNRFALFDLPYVPRQDIVKFMELGDLVHFASLSKRTKNMVKILRKNFTFFRLSFSACGILHLTLIPHEHAVLTCVVTPLPGAPEQETSGEIRQIAYKEPTEDSRKEVFEQFVRLCLDLFHVKSLIVTFMEPFDYESCFAFKLTKYIIIMDIWHVDARSPVISANALKFGLDAPPVKGLTIRGNVEPGFKYYKPLTTNLACHNDASWLQFESIYNMECNFFQLEIHDHFSSLQLNMIIKRWVSGDGLRRLNNFQMKTKANGYKSVTVMLEAVLDGLEEEQVEDWDFNLREQRYRGLCCAEFSNGSCIRRKNGQRAAVYIRNHTFQFLVVDDHF